LFSLATKLMKASTLRRVISLVCILAFFSVSLAHSFHHFGEKKDAAVIQTGLSLANVITLDSGDADGSSTAAVDHCHACCMAALPVMADVVDMRCAANDPWPGLPRVGLTFRLVAETPPPIAAI
jgi:hypothetical protein